MKTFDGTPIATLHAANGVTFNMRLVRKGQGYGVKLAVIHDKDEPLVEFYDSRYVFSGEPGAEYGQFVSRYYLRMIMGAGGINLDGGVDAWTIDAGTMALARQILVNWTPIR